MVALLGVSCSLAFKAGDCAFAGAVRPLHTPVAKQKRGAAVPAHKSSAESSAKAAAPGPLDVQGAGRGEPVRSRSRYSQILLSFFGW
jgi:hypothetical protein